MTPHGNTGRQRPDLAASNRARARHGLADTKVHNTWSRMRRRCGNPADKDYDNYGGRGIRVCDRWSSFENFLADMGEPLGADQSIDRIDANGNYEPGNCRWADKKTQANNKRSSVFVEYDGARRTVAEWAPIVGIERKTLEYRIRVGWSPERALTTPSTIPRKETSQ